VLAGRLLLLLLLAWPAAIAAAAQGERVLLDPANGGITLDQGQVSFLRDPDSSLTLDEVRAADARGAFRPLTGNLGAGYTDETYWLRFSLRQQGDDRRWWLEVLPPFLDDVQLHLVHPDGSIETRREGDRQPRTASQLDHRSILFRLELSPGDHTGYLRISTGSSMVAVLRVWHGRNLVESSFGQYLLSGLYLGLLAAVMLLIAINWLLLRSRLYLLYLAYIGMLLLHGLAYSGLAAQYIFPSIPEIPDMMVGLGMALATAFGLAFFDRMLDLDEVRHRYLRRLFMFTSLLAIVTAMSAVSGHYVYVAPWLQGAILLVIAGTLPVVAARIRHGSATQRLTGMAFVIYSLLLLFGALAYLGLLPTSQFSIMSAHLGNLAHLFLLHAAIVLRTRASEREREALARQAEASRLEMEQERQRRDEHDQFLSMVVATGNWWTPRG